MLLFLVVEVACNRLGDDAGTGDDGSVPDVADAGSESETGAPSCLDADAHPEIQPLLCPAITEGTECALWVSEPIPPCTEEPVDDGECACEPQVYQCGFPAMVYCCCMQADIDGPL